MKVKQTLLGLLAAVFILASVHYYKSIAYNKKSMSPYVFINYSLQNFDHYTMIDEESIDCEFYPEYPTDCVMMA